MTTKKPAAPHVVLTLPQPVDTLITLGTAVHDSVAANPTLLPSPSPALTVLSTHLGSLQTQQVAVKAHTPGALVLRDAACALVKADLRQLKAYVQQLVCANPSNAAAIALAAGMRLAKTGAFAKPPLAAKQTVSGTVVLVAKATAGSKAYEWQYSTDGGKTWLTTPASTKAETAIAGLVPGTTVLFRHRAVVKGGPEDWGQTIQRIVT